MRTTVELPDDLLTAARVRAAERGISLKDFFVEAVEEKLAPKRAKSRSIPPTIGDPDATPIGVLTPEQIDEAMFG